MRSASTGVGSRCARRCRSTSISSALGDKTGPLDRRGGTFIDWNTDAFGFAPSSDPIYKSIPFYIGGRRRAARYGLFLDNSWRSTFDFGHRDAAAIEISAPDGPIDYYVIAGPTIGRRCPPLYRPHRQGRR